MKTKLIDGLWEKYGVFGIQLEPSEDVLNVRWSEFDAEIHASTTASGAIFSINADDPVRMMREYLDGEG